MADPAGRGVAVPKRDTKFVVEWLRGGTSPAKHLRTDYWVAVLKLEAGISRRKLSIDTAVVADSVLRREGPKKGMGHVLYGLTGALTVLRLKYYEFDRRSSVSGAEMYDAAQKEPLLLMMRAAFDGESLLDYWREIANNSRYLPDLGTAYSAEGTAYEADARWFIETYKVRLTFPDELLTREAQLRIED